MKNAKEEASPVSLDYKKIELQNLHIWKLDADIYFQNEKIQRSSWNNNEYNQ